MTPTVFALIIILLSFYFIGKSAGVLIDALIGLGKRLGWNDFVVGFVVLGVATSLPEMFVGVRSGLSGVPQMSLGNLLGGIVVLFTLLIGVNALLQGMIATGDKFTSTNIFAFVSRIFPFWRPHFFVKDLILMAAVILLPLLLLVDGGMSRLDGVILIGAYLFFTLRAVYDRPLAGFEPEVEKKSWGKIIFWLAVGFVGLLIFSWLIVDRAIFLADVWGLSPILLGVLILSIGTNFPELTLTLKARLHNSEVVVGDIFGSALANIMVLGIVALFFPFSILTWQPFIIMAVSLILATLVLMIFLHTKNRLDKWEGVVLIFIYFVYLAVELYKL